MLDTKTETFLKVVQTGSYTKAAQALNLTQPAVSQQIRLLEKELGVKLFRRAGNTIRLTPEGKKAAETAKEMEICYRRLRNGFSNETNRLTSLNIGITHTVESNRITEVIARYALENEGITIKLVSGTPSKLIKKLKNYDIDFMIIDDTITEPGYRSEPLDADTLVLVTDPENPLANKAAVTIDDIRKEKLILRLPNSGTGNLFAAALEKHNMSTSDFNVILEVDNIATIKDLVRHGYGVSVLARSACLDEVSRGKIAALPILDLPLDRTVSIVCADQFPHTAVIEELIRNYHENLGQAE